MKILPSAFQFIEAPAYYSYEKMKSAYLSEQVVGYFAGMIALPIAIAAIPVSLLADMITGVAEVSISLYEKGLTRETKEVFHHALIATPLQQLAFSSAIIAVAWVITNIWIQTIPMCIAILWPIMYFAGQWSVFLLPDTLNHKQTNIFFRGGLREASTGNSFFADDLEIAIKKKVVGLSNGLDILNAVVEEVLKQAKEGKIIGFTDQDIENNDPSYYQKATNYVIYEMISACNPKNNSLIINELVRLSKCSQTHVESLNHLEKKFSLEEIRDCKKLLSGSGELFSKNVQGFFVKLGMVVTPCLSNSEFYNLL